MATILIVEDERAMLNGLRDNLEAEGYSVKSASDGPSGLELILAGDCDLVVLDVMLPRMSGFDVLKRVRAAGMTVPVILLTAKGEEIDRVVGLELGADDYITKPFSLREFLARVKAVLRRADRLPAATVFELGAAVIDLAACTITRNGTEVSATSKEFDLLKFLWQHRNEAVSRDTLLSKVWGYDATVSSRTVDNFIVRLRQKIEEDPGHPRHILTVHGTGYKLVS